MLFLFDRFLFFMKATIIIRNHDDFMIFLIGYNRKKSDYFAYKMFPIPFLIIRKFYSFGFFLFFFSCYDETHIFCLNYN